ncbi:hypothetical protein M513_12216 [Trichuris suis]|uniref:Metallo-beta-lactamase domain-containing protein n=1 Tax=Trichuris suis TaxID=68888 RepID=A0A085LPN0_9BILA|nr:hypothetical protein M513_12216 [Trichuris suis]
MAFDVWAYKDLKSRLRKRSSKQDDQLGVSVEAKAERAMQRSITSFIKVKEKFIVSEMVDYSESLQSSSRTSPKDVDLNNTNHPPPVASSNSVQITSQQQTKLTAFFTCSGRIASRAKFPETKSGNEKVLQEFAGRKNSSKCPFFKFIPGTSCVVDAFMYGYLPQVQMYFLSHFHSDHYSGLNRRFSMPIYCSKRRLFCVLSLCSSGVECFSITSFIKVKEKFIVSEMVDYSESLQSSSRTSPKDVDLNNTNHPPPVASSNSVQITSQQQTKLTAFFTCSGRIASRAKFPETKSGNEKVLQEFAGRKNSSKCPFFKFIPGTSCVVDAFMYGYLPKVQMYFLSHFHSDHYSGLNRRFSMPIYCSKVIVNATMSAEVAFAHYQVTARLVALKLKVDRRFLHVLELNHWSILPDGTAVMAIDANHCPGALMFIFKTKNGENILHTGDFRAEDIILQNSVWEQVQIDVILLDTTYCDPEYVFPKQHVVISQALDFIQAKMKIHPKLLIVIGAYTIGKERIFAAIAEAFDCKICVERSKMQVLNCIDDASLRARLTLQKTDTFLHVMPMASVTRKKLTEYLKVYPTYEHVLGILPTGWQIGSVRRSLLEPLEETNAVTLLGDMLFKGKMRKSVV